MAHQLVPNDLEQRSFPPLRGGVGEDGVKRSGNSACMSNRTTTVNLTPEQELSVLTMQSLFSVCAQEPRKKFLSYLLERWRLNQNMNVEGALGVQVLT